MIIGFGEKEKRLENQIEEAICLHVLEQYCLSDAVYFTDEFKEHVALWANDMSLKSREAADIYKTAENPPERYSYFWISVVADASHMCFIVKFHHINRRHALSPDGWAVMLNEHVFCVHEWDAGEGRRKAA